MTRPDRKHLSDLELPIAPESSTRDTPGERYRVAEDPLSEQERAYLTLLFNKYRGSLHRYLRGLVSSAEDVFELVQETYARVLRHTDTVRLEPVARAYLFHTAANVAREYYRRRATRRHKDHFPIDETEIEADSLAPESDVLWQEMLERLKTELNEMPQPLRDVVVLNRFENKTYSEIAVLLGVSTRTVERRMVQAIELLAQRMENLR